MNAVALLIALAFVVFYVEVHRLRREKVDASFPDLLFAKMMLLGLPYSVTVSSPFATDGTWADVHIEMYPLDSDRPADVWDGTTSPEDLAEMREWIRSTALALWEEKL